MSYDVFFAPCRYDGTTEHRRNPFTGQMQDVPRNAPLSEAEVAAVRAALVRVGAKDGGDDVYLVQLADGANAEVYAKDLQDGCMFAIRGAGVTPLLAQLLFDVMVAGSWTLAGTGDEDFVIAPNEECVKSQPDFGRVVVAASAGEVAALLSGGFDAWKRYRDHVIGR